MHTVFSIHGILPPIQMPIPHNKALSTESGHITMPYDIVIMQQ